MDDKDAHVQKLSIIICIIFGTTVISLVICCYRLYRRQQTSSLASDTLPPLVWRVAQVLASVEEGKGVPAEVAGYLDIRSALWSWKRMPPQETNVANDLYTDHLLRMQQRRGEDLQAAACAKLLLLEAGRLGDGHTLGTVVDRWRLPLLASHGTAAERVLELALQQFD